MDLGFISRKCARAGFAYTSVELWMADVRLIGSNAAAYHQADKNARVQPAQRLEYIAVVAAQLVAAVEDALESRAEDLQRVDPLFNLQMALGREPSAAGAGAGVEAAEAGVGVEAEEADMELGQDLGGGEMMPSPVFPLGPSPPAPPASAPAKMIFSLYKVKPPPAPEPTPQAHEGDDQPFDDFDLM
jgi:hypothetical protein